MRDKIHLTKQGKNIFANRLANLMRRVLNWVILEDDSLKLSEEVVVKGDKFKGQRNGVRVPSGKIKQVKKRTHVKCLYPNACSLGNKQEELELHVWTQNSEIIGRAEKWWGSSWLEI